MATALSLLLKLHAGDTAELQSISKLLYGSAIWYKAEEAEHVLS